ncbi:glutathione S-transferase protein [Ancylostoma ceylanicum]|uniref:glutathione transferase n=1 Tax=Ancylostoma ceylanicum TaxID=53326 RepID=A0A0D6M9K5_9BILA|nr:glutathione S-transferase protein [Ancylostoma ceylanicum]
MVHYKLTYFDIRGAGECARQILALGGQEFEDNRLAKEDFAALKPNLAGKTPFDEALVDSLADQHADFRVEIKPYFYTAIGMREGDLEQLKKDVLLPARDKFFGFLNKFLKQNSCGFLVGDSVTWVDVIVSESIFTLLSFVPELLDGYPEVKAHMEKRYCMSLMLGKLCILMGQAVFVSKEIMVHYKLTYFDLRGSGECARQEQLKEEVFLPARDKFYGSLTKFLKGNPSDKQLWHILGQRLKGIDLSITCLKVKAHMEKVRAIPNLKKWIENSPVRPF